MVPHTSDGRVMFALPWGDLSYVGTTETPFEGTPETVMATADDQFALALSVPPPCSR